MLLLAVVFTLLLPSIRSPSSNKLNTSSSSLLLLLPKLSSKKLARSSSSSQLELSISLLALKGALEVSDISSNTLSISRNDKAASEKVSKFKPAGDSALNLTSTFLSLSNASQTSNGVMLLCWTLSSSMMSSIHESSSSAAAISAEYVLLVSSEMQLERVLLKERQPSWRDCSSRRLSNGSVKSKGAAAVASVSLLPLPGTHSDKLALAADKSDLLLSVASRQ
mmetsp:Transcript_70726/g.147299  ORF Transcript_70726/g.147299 Transcript_70726/m.147299 type:complete len:223 (-) Transcript_70726:529-1197(-)